MVAGTVIQRNRQIIWQREYIAVDRHDDSLSMPGMDDRWYPGTSAHR
jgi:hypothetical protein